MVVCLGLSLMVGCGDDRDVVFSTDSAPKREDQKALQADLQALANDPDDKNAAKVKKYHDAVDALIGRGASIESTLIEILGSSENQQIRLGVIEVLKGVGTRQSIEPLMGALEDPYPLVALNAHYLLREMTSHNVIPASGEPPRDGLPPVPSRAADDHDMRADERLWAAWHKENRVTLHRNWRTWWEANRKATVIK